MTCWPVRPLPESTRKDVRHSPPFSPARTHWLITRGQSLRSAVPDRAAEELCFSIPFHGIEMLWFGCPPGRRAPAARMGRRFHPRPGRKEHLFAHRFRRAAAQPFSHSMMRMKQSKAKADNVCVSQTGLRWYSKTNICAFR